MLALLLALNVAQASPLYPYTLQEEAGGDCTPVCTVCHENTDGGEGTVVQPFGLAMIDRGLEGDGNTPLLAEVFAEHAADGEDTDGDGTSDADELAAGFDPNPGGTTFCDVEPPVYGCFSHTGAAPAGFLALLGAVLAVARRRR